MKVSCWIYSLSWSNLWI